MIMKTAPINLLLENADYNERREILALTEAEAPGVNSNLIGKLYNQVIDKAHIDFEDIPKSKGDITSYKGYKSMTETIEILKQLSDKAIMKIDELEVVDTALRNIVAHRNAFELGFKLDKEFVIMQYNLLVAACVESTSILITSYVEFIKRVDKVEFSLVNNKYQSGALCIDCLRKFNKSISSGEFSKVIALINKGGKESFVGSSTLAITAGAIAAIGASVVIMRELVYQFINGKASLSDNLEQQAMFLEMNKNALRANDRIPAQEKLQIMKKQEKLAEKLRKLSDKLKVSQITADTKAKENMKADAKGWKIKDIKDESSSIDGNGFQLL